jgi:hypothetical protein
MIQLTKRLFGPNVEIRLVGESKEEVIQWRDFFYNHGAIQMGAGKFDPCFDLEQQEKEVEEIRGKYYSLMFMAKKELVVKTFIDAEEIKVDWDTITERGGQRARRNAHAEAQTLGLKRFEEIPGHSELVLA